MHTQSRACLTRAASRLEPHQKPPAAARTGRGESAAGTRIRPTNHPFEREFQPRPSRNKRSVAKRALLLSASSEQIKPEPSPEKGDFSPEPRAGRLRNTPRLYSGNLFPGRFLLLRRSLLGRAARLLRARLGQLNRSGRRVQFKLFLPALDIFRAAAALRDFTMLLSHNDSGCCRARSAPNVHVRIYLSFLRAHGKQNFTASAFSRHFYHGRLSSPQGPQPGKGAPWLTSCLPFKILPAIINP